MWAAPVVWKSMDRFAEALEMVDFALAEVFDGVADVGIVDEAQDIIVGHARLLLC